MKICLVIFVDFDTNYLPGEEELLPPPPPHHHQHLNRSAARTLLTAPLRYAISASLNVSAQGGNLFMFLHADYRNLAKGKQPKDDA